MPTLSELKKDQGRVKDDLLNLIDSFQQLAIQEKTAAYRDIQEIALTSIQDKAALTNLTIETNSPKIDAEYEQLYLEIIQLMDEYKKLLESIPKQESGGSGEGNSGSGGSGGGNSGSGGSGGGNSGSGGSGGENSGSGGSSGENSGQNEHIKLMMSQNVRFNNFLKICGQILQQKRAGETISISYGKIKSALITSSWERIATAHEALGSTGTYTQLYLNQMNDCEGALEAAMLFLQEAMDKPNDRNDGVKLERVTIPKFNGDYFKWVTFRDLFVALVVDNKKMSKATKLQMLKTNLTGEPEYLISDLTISDVNFSAAWDRLKHRYENKRVIVSQHLNKLITQAAGKWESKSLKRLLDTTDQIILALRNLGRPVEHWDDWIVFVVSQKFSEDTRKDWEKKIGSSIELPTWEELKKFLEEEFRMLEGVENTQRKPHQQTTASAPKNTINVYQSSIHKNGCVTCGNDHKLFNCEEFKKMNVKTRWELAKKAKLCFKCLKANHDKSSCNSQTKCKHCSKPHSTWLHDDNRKKSKEVRVNAATKGRDSNDQQNVVVASATIQENSSRTVALLTTPKQVLLATALVLTHDVNGHNVWLRALVDSGSQGSLITAQAANLLQLVLYKSHNAIAPLGGGTRKCSQTLMLTLHPHFNSNFECEAEFVVMPKLTRTLPDENIDIQEWTHLRGLQLADPKFNTVGPIDILLGADIISDIMKEGLLKGRTGHPMAQLTELGWIVSGKIDLSYQRNRINCMAATTVDYNYHDLQKFWELEDLNPKRSLTADETSCEQHYQTTFKRNKDGKFTVRIPFKNDGKGPERLGTSRRQCLARFQQLEKKLAQNPQLKAEYVQVMNEYIKMGHLKLVMNNPPSSKKYYIPHHAVIKPESLTTKTRVVFDASAKTSTGWSLNDCMHVGAKQQKDLIETLIKWRTYRIAFKADITKMYRMIHLDEKDQEYHTIFWREDPTMELLEYQLTTVTFGTAAAPFLAMRTLKQLASDEEKNHLVAAGILQNDFYVDDLISGCNTPNEAVQIKDEILKLMAKGGFELRKWSSNSNELLESLPLELTEKSLQTFKGDDMTKALGLQWNPQTDQFNFHISWNVEDETITKRRLFSEASKLFDPLGWLAPAVIMAKMYMQEIWAAKTNWDEEVSKAIQEKWTQFREELPLLEQIKVPRWIQYDEKSSVQLHGFCDASEKGYSAVVYTRIQNGEKVDIRLIASKTRVAPIQSKTTLPRLELCGAVLLSNLLTTVAESLQFKDVPITAWSDSMIALGWLKGTPSRWKTFVANRVSEIQSTRIDDWRHIKSADNPADCASRGMMPGDLKNYELWWEGPAWLKDEPNTWPSNEIIENEDDDSERKTISVNVITFETNEHAERSSSWFKLIRVTAYCLRMRNRLSRTPALTPLELKLAAERLIRQCQRDAFPDEICKLRNNKPLLKTSRLLQLDPFLDENEIMRVGGRLQQAPIAYENRHPAILPQNHKITTLIVQQMHLDTLHGGPQMMLGLLRKRYWILNAKRKITGEVRKCVHCRRMSAQTNKQKMGEFPKHRVSLVRPFLHSGVDYCGPFEIKSSTLRNTKIQKAYVAIFVCFGTKAFHLELISDQTTEAFLAAFNRFIARRGLCETMYSDNGGNFTKGASILEKEERNWLKQRSEDIKILLNQKGIEWKFNPPEGPNFGGLWERGVKSVKHHLKRTLRTACLTFEEYATVLCQVEACLNSRPLCPLTNEIDTLNVLTPGHFLIGDALMAPPQQQLVDNTFNKRHRWQHLQLLQQHFWNRWHKEYLSQLQQRSKWKVGEADLKVGDMVLLKDEDLPPRRWLMGRVQETFPGSDQKVRVVSVRTHTNGDPKTRKIILLKRSVRNLVLLLPEEEKSIKMKPATRDTVGTVKLNNIEVPLHTCKEPKPSSSTGKNLTSQDEQRTRQKKPNPTTSYNLRPKKVNFATLFALIICAMLFGGGLAQELKHVKNTEFKVNSGLYFEDIGRAQAIRTNWNIYIHFDLEGYYTEFKRLQGATKDLQDSCIKMEVLDIDDHCHEISGLLTEKTEEIKHLNALIKANGEVTQLESRISKRAAPFNIVGWASHQVFGIMASEQAEQIEDEINLAKENRQHLLELVKKQTTVVENTVNLMKRTHDDINKSYSKIDTILAQMKTESNDIIKKEKLLGLALYTALLVNRFEKAQQNILDLVTDVQKGHISTHAFTPQQLQDQLVIINNNLPPGSKLFEDGQHDIKSVYKLMHCTTRVTNKNLLVHLSIPLVSVMDYRTYHIIPIPTKHQGHFVSIIPESKYLMITLKKDSFYQLSSHEWNTCVKPGSTAICKLKQPAYNSQSTKSQCERDLLGHKLEFSDKCIFNITKEQDFWLQLQQKNSWIYSLQKSTQLNIVCDQQIHTTTLKEAGIIELAPGCEAIQPGMTIAAESDKISEGNFTFIPTLDFSKTVATSEGRTKLRLINTTINHADQLNSLQEQIQELHAQSRLNKHFHYVHHGTTIIMFVTLGILILLIWIKRQWLIVKFTRGSQRSNSTTNLDNDIQETISQEDGRQENPRNEDNDSIVVSDPAVSTTRAVVTDNK